MKYHFYCDDGHAWLKVSRKELIDLDILYKISSYSYERGEFVYLEEDRDAEIFVRTLISKNLPFEYEEHFSKGRSSIRNYNPFRD